MDLRHLRYFVAAVEAGSLQGAAQRLNVAQPALSRRIRDLEASLDCDLFVRGARGVTPTRAGASLYRDATAILEKIETARQHTRDLGHEEDRVVRLGLVPLARKYHFLQDAMTAFACVRASSDVVFTRAASSDLAARLRDGRIDITMLHERHADAIDIGERLVQRESYVVAAHPDNPLARAPALSLAMLSGAPLVWLSRQDDTDHHDLLLQTCRLHGLEPLVAHMAQCHEEQIDLVAVSGGACLTPASTFISTPTELLRFRPLPYFDMAISLSMAWRHTDPSSLAGTLLATLHRAIDKHQAAVRDGSADGVMLEGHRIIRAPDIT